MAAVNPGVCSELPSCNSQGICKIFIPSLGKVHLVPLSFDFLLLVQLKVHKDCFLYDLALLHSPQQQDDHLIILDSPDFLPTFR
jgi:hypothetical protein